MKLFYGGRRIYIYKVNLKLEIIFFTLRKKADCKKIYV